MCFQDVKALGHGRLEYALMTAGGQSSTGGKLYSSRVEKSDRAGARESRRDR